MDVRKSPNSAMDGAFWTVPSTYKDLWDTLETLNP